jgi:hypothetical protein
MDFGLACEGVTDQITIENILCGYFNYIDDLDEEITYIQPAFDETNKKQSGYGGWQLLLQYLSMKRFRDDVLNHKYVIIQVDTDVSKDIGFDVPHVDCHNKEISTLELLNNVKNELITRIEIGDINFYKKYKNNIIFCIAVHSIECWILAYYAPKKPPKIKNCSRSLEFLLSKGKIKVGKVLVKNENFYNRLSSPFLEKKHIQNIYISEPSFREFIDNLSCLSYPNNYE